MVVLLMLIPLLAPKEGAAIGFATISKALGCGHLSCRMQGADTVGAHVLMILRFSLRTRRAAAQCGTLLVRLQGGKALAVLPPHTGAGRSASTLRCRSPV